MTWGSQVTAKNIKEETATVRMRWCAINFYSYSVDIGKSTFPTMQCQGDVQWHLSFNINPNHVVFLQVGSVYPLYHLSQCYPPVPSQSAVNHVFALFCSRVPSLRSWRSSCRAQQCSYVITALWSLSITFFCPDATLCVWTLWGPVNPSPWHLSGSSKNRFLTEAA